MDLGAQAGCLTDQVNILFFNSRAQHCKSNIMCAGQAFQRSPPIAVIKFFAIYKSTRISNQYFQRRCRSQHLIELPAAMSK